MAEIARSFYAVGGMNPSLRAIVENVIKVQVRLRVVAWIVINPFWQLF